MKINIIDFKLSFSFNWAIRFWLDWCLHHRIHWYNERSRIIL